MKERMYSERIADAINGYLAEDDWNFSFDKKHGLFKFGLSLKGKIKKIGYIIDVKENEYVVYAISPLGADEDDKEMMTSMAEFICRANYGLVNGNFELDMRDGEIRFKCFVDCEGITPTSAVVRNSIHCPAAMFERYGAGMVDIVFGNASAKEAVEYCEKSTEDEFRSLLREVFLREGDRELSGKLSGLMGTADELGLSDDEEATDTDRESVHIKTDLFATEGAEA